MNPVVWDSLQAMIVDSEIVAKDAPAQRNVYPGICAEMFPDRQVDQGPKIPGGHACLLESLPDELVARASLVEGVGLKT